MADDRGDQARKALEAKKRSVLESLEKDLQHAQACMYVSIVKEPGKNAVFVTGGFKLLGPTPQDLTHAIGVLLGELADNVSEMARAVGVKGASRRTTLDAMIPEVRRRALSWSPGFGSGQSPSKRHGGNGGSVPGTDI